MWGKIIVLLRLATFFYYFSKLLYNIVKFNIKNLVLALKLFTFNKFTKNEFI